MRPDLIVIHDADTPNGSYRYDIADIDSWHGERGFMRQRAFYERARPNLRHFGYHALVDPGGKVHKGRETDEKGAHATGVNGHSLGVCLLGRDEFTLDAWMALNRLLRFWSQEFNVKDIVGHRDTPHQQALPENAPPGKRQRKSYPGFSVDDYLRGGMIPLEGHILLP